MLAGIFPAGTSTSGWWTTVPGSGDPSFADVPGYMYPNLTGEGVIYSLSMVTFAKVSDGLSNTYLLGEKYLNSDNYDNSLEGTDNNPAYSGFDWDFQRWSGNGLRRDRKGLSDWLSFGSAHPAGANMGFCDGSVRHITFTIDPIIHSYMCSRADGKVVDFSKF